MVYSLRVLCLYNIHAVKLPKKGHIGNNVNSHNIILSLVERLASSRRFKMYYYMYYRKTEFFVPKIVHCREVYYNNTVSLSVVSLLDAVHV